MSSRKKLDRKLAYRALVLVVSKGATPLTSQQIKDYFKMARESKFNKVQNA